MLNIENNKCQNVWAPGNINDMKFEFESVLIIKYTNFSNNLTYCETERV